MTALAPTFLSLAGLAVGAGWLWSRRKDPGMREFKREYDPKNPLELRAAILFGALFLTMLIATHVVAVHLGNAGVYSLAAVMGLADVDPFIMGMTQSAGSITSLSVASASIVIAAASNNVVKGLYAFTLSDRRTGMQSLFLLVSLAALGLVPLLWLAR
jgi:uncharacterized membrane protein (DUF4010 family)